MDDKEVRMEAADRAYRYYELQGIDSPDSNSEEWREMVAMKYRQIIGDED